MSLHSVLGRYVPFGVRSESEDFYHIKLLLASQQSLIVSSVGCRYALPLVVLRRQQSRSQPFDLALLSL